MEISNNKRLIKIEALLRLFALLTLLIATIVLVTDKQTKIYFGYYKMKISYKMIVILKLSLIVYGIGAIYNLLQLVRCLASYNKKYRSEDKLSWSDHILQWVIFLLDQMAVYIVFSIACASTQVAIYALTGANELEWMKVCSKFMRFCFQIGGSIACGIVASAILAVISGISTFNLFRWYSPNFLCLKPKKIGIVATTN